MTNISNRRDVGGLAMGPQLGQVPRAVRVSIRDVNNRATDCRDAARRVAEAVQKIRIEFYGNEPDSNLGENARGGYGSLTLMDATLAETADMLQQVEDELNVLRTDLFGPDLDGGKARMA